MEAARGSGLLTLHLLHPSPPLLRLDSQQSARLEEVLVYRNDFFADEQKPEKLPWSDGGGQLATAAECAPINPRDSSPGTTGTTIRLGKGQGQGSSPCPLPAGSGSRSNHSQLPFQSNIHCCAHGES